MSTNIYRDASYRAIRKGRLIYSEQMIFDIIARGRFARLIQAPRIQSSPQAWWQRSSRHPLQPADS